MNKETLHFTVGPLIGEHLLEIAQTNISNGNVEYGANVYKMAFAGFTDELTLKVLKNQLVVITDDRNAGQALEDRSADGELLQAVSVILRRMFGVLQVPSCVE